MVKLDISRLPRNVMAIMVQRGTELPPLQWQTNPNRLAKQKLDEIGDDSATLLGGTAPDDQGMVAAVRGLLYIWTGWLADAHRAAKAAPAKERAYIGAIATRHAGQADTSKALFQEVNGHPIFKPLGEYAAGEIGLAVAPGLKRLRQVIDFGETWEPYAFGDVYEETRAGKLDPAGERVVRNLQCYEFELLLTHCLEAATAKKLAKA